MFLFVPTVILFAQTNPTQASDKCKLEGRVVNSVTGEAVRKVSLTVRHMTERGVSFSAITDDEGRFRFDKLEPGTYRLSAERSGYLSQQYGARTTPYTGTPITLIRGQHLKDLEFKLLPQGSISGKVVDEDGEPIHQASVNVTRQGRYARRGSGGTFGVEGQSTNDLGEFRIANLAPGRYFVTVMYRPGMMFGGDAPRSLSEKPEETYVPTFYPGVTDRDAAVPLEVGAGQALTGLVIQMRKGRTYRVRGKVVGASRNVRVWLTPRERTSGMFFAGRGGMLKPDGSFELAGVLPGTYYVLASRMEGRGQMIGRAPVHVTDGNVDEVLIMTAEPLTVTGTIRVEGGQPLVSEQSPMQPSVNLMPDGPSAYGQVGARVKDDGTFQIEGVSRDKFFLNLYGIPEGTYVRSVRMGGQEVVDKGFDLSQLESAPALEVILSPKAAVVEGLVRDGDKLAAGMFVTLVHEPFRPEKRYLIKNGTTDQNGAFSIKGVAPGAYRAYAWEEMVTLGSSLDAEAVRGQVG